MTTSDLGVAMIKKFEGFSPVLYQDQGHPCIGYGCDLSNDDAAKYEGRSITADEADALLHQHLKSMEVEISNYVHVGLLQNQFDALADFVYNEGIGHLLKSTLLAKLNANDYAGAADEFLRWDFAGGKKDSGLDVRRKTERALFLSQPTPA